MTHFQLFSIVGSLALLGLVIELIRRKQLLERYALLWIFGALFFVLLAAWPGLLDHVAPLLGIAYPPAILFLAGLFILVLLAIHFSVIASRLSEQNQRLAQKVGLLEALLEGREPTPPDGDQNPPPEARAPGQRRSLE